MSRILAVSLSSTLQKTILFPGLSLDRVNRAKGYRMDASGKAVNAARVLNQLERGCVSSVVPLGTENSALFLELAEKDGLEVSWVPVPGRTRYCYTCVDPNEGSTTELVVDEPVDPSSVASEGFAAAADAILEKISEALTRADALLFAGSRPKAWPEDMSARICSLVKDAGKVVMADFHGKDLSLALESRVPDIIKINEDEFCATFGFRSGLEPEKLGALIAQKSRELDNALVVTRGSLDTYAGFRGTPFVSPVRKVKALNATGCGDSFSAGFLYAWLPGNDMAAALEKGAWCATRNALNLRPGSIRDANDEGEFTW